MQNRRNFVASLTGFLTFLPWFKSKADTRDKHIVPGGSGCAMAMVVLQVLGGFTPKEAEECRKAVTKRLPEREMWRQKFGAGVRSRYCWHLPGAFWHAVTVSFVTGYDGFDLLEIKEYTTAVIVRVQDGTYTSLASGKS